MSEQKNEIVVLLNEFSFEIEKNIKILGKISTIEISNIANIYKNKILEVEDVFEKYSISFYEDDLLVDIVCNYFDKYYIRANKILTNLACKVLDKNMSLKYFYRNIKIYQDICNYLNSFKIENSIEEIFLDLFNKSKNNNYKKQLCFIESILYKMKLSNKIKTL